MTEQRGVLLDLQAKRKCGSCSACCTVLAVAEIQKPRFTRCPQLKQTGSTRCCKVYDQKPEACTAYSCAWLLGFGNKIHRPDASGIVFSVEDTILGPSLVGLEVRAGASNSSNNAVQTALALARKNNFGLFVGDKLKRRLLNVPKGKEDAVIKVVEKAKADGYHLKIE